jgi:hypothetical protein
MQLRLHITGRTYILWGPILRIRKAFEIWLWKRLSSRDSLMIGQGKSRLESRSRNLIDSWDL